MIITELFPNANQPMAEVAGPEKCWPGHRKVGTKPGTGKYAGQRVNDCKKIDEQGVAKGIDNLAYDAQSLIMKLRRDVEEKRLQPTRQAVLSAARELAGDMNFAPELLVRQVLGSGVAEAMKGSDIPPSMRQRLTMRDVEAERPRGAFRFRVVTPRGDAMDFMDRSAADDRARATGGRVEPIDAQSRGMPVTQIPEDKKPGARIERILKMLRARNPQAEDDLEALIFDFRGQQSQDRSDIARLDAENDAEEADIARLEKMLDLIRQRRGTAAVAEDQDTEMQDFLARGGKIQQEPGRMPRLGARLRRQGSRHIGQGSEPRAGQLTGRGANVNVRSGKTVVTAEGLQPGEYHVATVTLDDGTVKRVRITADEGFRDSIVKHFARQGREVKDIDMDYAVRSDFAENKPGFTGVPPRPPPRPVNPNSPILPPAPGRPTFVEAPVQEAKKKPVPTNPELWGRAKSAARAKFDVYPSAYANGWAAKWYKSKGGGWRMGKPKKK